MNVLRIAKAWLKASPRLYNFYQRIRYGSLTEVRDWVLETHDFLQGHKLNTFIFEQDGVYVRISGGEEFKYVPELMGGLLGLEYETGFEAEDIQAVLGLLPSNAVVLDIGANFGIYTVLIASRISGSMVHAFEPVPGTARLLSENVARNDVIQNVVINNVAVGREEGMLSITVDRYAGNYLLTQASYSGNSQKVPVIRLDDYVAHRELSRVDFIKCDVEGAELLVMHGAAEILERHHPIVMLELVEEWVGRFGYSIDELKDFMSQKGYECKPVAEIAADQSRAPEKGDEIYNYLFFPVNSKYLQGSEANSCK